MMCTGGEHGGWDGSANLLLGAAKKGLEYAASCSYADEAFGAGGECAPDAEGYQSEAACGRSSSQCRELWTGLTRADSFCGW